MTTGRRRTPDVVFSFRDVTIYRPFVGEVPSDLVGAGAELNDVRIAKFDGRIVGAYRLAQVAADRFEIAALAVYPDFRGAGIGRWLLGHAIGIAESRGGRVIDATGPERLFLGAGFVPWDHGFRLLLTPE